MDLRKVSKKEYIDYYDNNSKLYTAIDNFDENGPHWNRTQFYLNNINKNDKILDCGCSNGGLSKYLTELGYNVVSFDIAFLHAKNTTNSVTANIEYIPFKDKSFNIIIAGEILEHVQNIDKSIEECKRVLCDKGNLLITVPKPPYDTGEQHLRKINKDTLKEKLPNIKITDGNSSILGCYTKPSKQKTISLVTIVKNGEETLKKCVDSVKDIIDEFIIVDTGSTDSTKDIIKEYGKLYEIPFEDFTNTKNEALKLATSDYILFMDADEYVLDNLHKLKEYANNGVDSVQCRIIEGTDEIIVCSYFRDRLWKNNGKWKFQGPGVHEVICGTGDNQITDGSITVRHDHTYKQDKPEVYTERFNSYVKVLTKHIKENPDATREHFYLARTYNDLGQTYKAIDMFKKYLSMPNIFFRDEIWQAWYNLAKCYKSLGEYTKAEEACKGAMEVDDRRAEAYNLIGLMKYNLQDWNEAIYYYELGFSKDFPEDVILFINPQEYRFIPADNLSICYHKIKDYNKSELYASIANERGNEERVLNNLFWIRKNTQMTVFLTLGLTPEPVYGGMMDKQGVGGVETTYIELANELTKLGHTVFLFSNCEKEHKYNNVYYVPYTDIENYLHINPDVMITSRWFDALYLEENSKKVIWFQDAHFNEPNTPDVFSKVDLIVCSSPWHRDYIAERYSHGIDARKIKIIPLGIKKELFKSNIKKIPNKVFYSSNPDRGLYILLDMWEEITEKLPDIQLFIYYGWEGLKTWGKNIEWENSVDTQMKNAYEKASKFDNVHFTGRLTKQELANEMLSGELCLYPNNFNETFCLTALETQMAGVPMITSDRGALSTTLCDANILINSDPFGTEYKKEFICRTVDLMTNRNLLSNLSNRCKNAEINDWCDVSQLWQQRIWELSE